MAQFVTHIQPTLVEAAQGHVPHHHGHQVGLSHGSHLPHSGHNMPSPPILNHHHHQQHNKQTKHPQEHYQPSTGGGHHQTVSNLEFLSLVLSRSDDNFV